MKKHLKYLETGVFLLLSSMYTMKDSLAGQQQPSQNNYDQNNYDQNNYDNDMNSSQSGQPGGGYPQQPGGVGQQPGGYAPPAPAGDNGSSALFNAIKDLGTAALTTNAQTQQLGISTQATTRQAQDLEQTQLGLQRNAIVGGQQQQAMNNQAAMMERAGGGYGVGVGSAGVDEGYVGEGNAAGHLLENHPGHISGEKQYPAEYLEQKNQRKQEKHKMELEEHRRKQVELKMQLEEHRRKQKEHKMDLEEHRRKQEEHKIKLEEMKRQPLLQEQVHAHQEGKTQQVPHTPVSPAHPLSPQKPLSPGAQRQQEQKAQQEEKRRERAKARAEKKLEKELQQTEKEKTKSLTEHYQEAPVKQAHPNQQYQGAAAPTA